MMKRWILIAASLFAAPLQVLAAAEPQAPTPQAAAPEKENALTYLVQAREAFKPYKYVEKAGKLEPPQGDAARRAIEENAKVFPLLERVVTLPLRFDATGRDPVSAQFKVMASVREMARLLLMRAAVQQEAGDAAGALRSGLLCVWLGQKMQEDGGMMPSLSGCAFEAIGLRAFSDLAPKWDAATLKSAARELGEAEAKRPTFSRTLDSERELTLKMTRQMLQGQALAVNGYDQATQDRLLAALREVAEQNDALFEQPFALIRGLETPLDTQEMENLPDELPVLGANFDAHAWAEAMQKVMLPNKYGALFLRTRAQTSIALMQAALAARAYQIEHNMLPASLQVLAPDYLPSVPNDPFDIGAPLQLKSEAGDIIIYSVGPDGLDDGGQDIQNLGADGKLAASKTVTQQSRGDMLAPAALLKS